MRWRSARWLANAGIMTDLTHMSDQTRKDALSFMEAENIPPIVTHDLVDDSKDDVLEKLRQCNLLNHEEDRVKIVFHPDFISPTSPLFGLEYDDFVRSVQRHKGDTESLEVMIALTTIGIRNRQQQLLKEPPNRSGVPRHIIKILVDRRRG